ADTAWLDWFFLNGTKIPRDSGLTGASVPFTLPTTPGTYEVRFFANNTYQRLGTTPTVTVADIPPVPGLSALQPMTVTAGSPGLTLSVDAGGVRSVSQVAVIGGARPAAVGTSGAQETTVSASEVATAGTS